MAAFDYPRAKATADRLIKRFGRTVSIRRYAESGDSWNPTVTSTDHTATAAIVDYTVREIDGTHILATDRKALLAVGDLAITPDPKDDLVIGAVAWHIRDVKPLDPGGTVVMYELQLRQ